MRGRSPETEPGDDARAVTEDPTTLTPRQRIALVEATLSELADSAGGILVGGEQAELLWHATVDSFAGGIWVATILCAQATCERALAGIVSLRELPGHAIAAPKGWEKWGLGTIVKHVRKQGWVPDDMLDDLEVLCEARKPYGHWRRPFDPGTLGRQIADELQKGRGVDPFKLRERILAEEARRSATTALRLYFGDYAQGPFDI
jgi:hypothetical protein